MSPSFLQQVAKMAEVADKISKIANLGTMTTKGILVNKELSKWANEGAKIQSLINKGLDASTSMSNYARMTNLVHTAPVYIKNAVDFKPIQFLEPLSLKNIKLSFEGSVTLAEISSLRNQVVHLDHISAKHEQKIQEKKKIEADLLSWFQNEESIDFQYEPYSWKLNEHFENKWVDFNTDVLYEATGIFKMQKEVEEYNKSLRDYESLQKFLELINIQLELKEEQRIVSLIYSLKKWLSSVFRLFQINRREYFRRINSFLFKNLDDYHSTALLSVGY